MDDSNCTSSDQKAISVVHKIEEMERQMYFRTRQTFQIVSEEDVDVSCRGNET